MADVGFLYRVSGVSHDMILISMSLLLAMTAAHGEDDQTPAAALVSSSRVLVIAHRGASATAPENTLPAFRLALGAKADLVELDYYHSADHVPIVFHDEHLDRTTNAQRVVGGEEVPVESRTVEQLKQLDAGQWFSPKFAGTRIPTLSEALDIIQAGSTTLIERKGGDARTCLDLLKNKQLGDHVVIQAFDWEFLSDLHQLAPTATIGALGDKDLTERRLDAIAGTGAMVVGWKHKDVGQKEIDLVHRRGLKIWVYTVNDDDVARRLISMGVDGIITDRPAEMRILVNSSSRK